MIVGKACDFDEALKFYKEHGYILASHSSWKFVNGVRVSHSGRAFAWDIIPLGHNGQLEDSKSREIIGVDLFSSSIPQGEWEDWLNEQNSIKWLGK